MSHETETNGPTGNAREHHLSCGHHKEWVVACKTGGPTSCPFDYAGALTEMVLLGNVAYRTGKPLTWDPKKLSAASCPEADRLIREEYRKGWTL